MSSLHVKKLEKGGTFHSRPPLDVVIRKFRAPRIVAYTAGVFFTLGFVGIWPVSMLSVGVLDRAGFDLWTVLSRAWAFVAAVFIIVVPLAQEVNHIMLVLQLKLDIVIPRACAADLGDCEEVPSQQAH